MPTYEFRCPEGHDFEKFYRTISGAESTATCPVCGRVAERRMSATGFAFKGSGFYLTDYGKNAHRGTAPESKSESKSEGTAEKGEKAEKSTGEPKSTPSAESSAPAASKADATPATKPASTSKPSTSE